MQSTIKSWQRVCSVFTGWCSFYEAYSMRGGKHAIGGTDRHQGVPTIYPHTPPPQ